MLENRTCVTSNIYVKKKQVKLLLTTLLTNDFKTFS